jgi:repressor of nif and glnA expression
MRKLVILELVRQLSAQPKLIKKLKIILIVGTISSVVFGGLLIWAGVSVFRTVAGSAETYINSPIAQSLLNVQPWLERPALENIKILKEACLGDVKQI